MLPDTKQREGRGNYWQWQARDEPALPVPWDLSPYPAGGAAAAPETTPGLTREEERSESFILIPIFFF